MTIEFKSLDEQIQILKDRNMTISDEYNTKKLLLRSNYYDIVNGYGSFLQDSTNHFFDGATFEELYSIYMYDKNIKSIFFRKIEKSESFLRSSIAYYFCKNHPEPWSYLKTDNFINKPLEVSKMTSNLSQLIKNQKRFPNNAISHYWNKYKSIPLWVLVNFMDFGQLRHFYRYMLDKDKLEIVTNINSLFFENYSIKLQLKPTQLDSYLENINEVRNIVAHDNRLLKYNLIKFSKPNDNISNFNPPTNTVFHVHLTMKLFLSVGQFNNFTRALKNRTKDLRRDLNRSTSSANIETILDSIGFVNDWLK